MRLENVRWWRACGRSPALTGRCRYRRPKRAVRAGRMANGPAPVGTLLELAVQELPDLRHHHRAFANRGGDALDRACPDIADGEYPGL
jgi:hypothetical protein